MNRTAIVGILVCVGLGVSLVIGAQLTGLDSGTSTITTVLGIIGVVVTQLLANRTTEEVKSDLRNGRVEKLVRESIRKIAAEGNSALNIVVDPETEKSGTGAGDLKGGMS